MSLILYNPLEAFILIFPFWFLNRSKLKFNNNKKKIAKNFLKDMFILGTIFLISQLPLNLLYDSIYYGFFNLINIGFTIIVLYFYNIIRFKNKKFLLCAIVEFLYVVSLLQIINHKNLFFAYEFLGVNFYQEFVINLHIKFLQFIILFLILGGYIMLKKKMVKESKKKLGKMVASTQFGFGEKKLSEKLKTEVRKSK